MKIGDFVKIKSLANLHATASQTARKNNDEYKTVLSFGSHAGKATVTFTDNTAVYIDEIETNEGVVPMLKTIGSDLKAFIAEHKSTIYWIALMFLLDHVLFQGAFRERLHGLMNKLLGKVESQIDGGKTVSLVAEQKS